MCGLTSSEEKNHLLPPADNIPPHAAQDTVSLLCSKGTLLAHIQPAAHQDPQVLFCKAVF